MRFLSIRYIIAYSAIVIVVNSSIGCTQSTPGQLISSATPVLPTQTTMAVPISAQNADSLQIGNQFGVDGAIDFVWCEVGSSLCVASEDGVMVYGNETLSVSASVESSVPKLLTTSSDQKKLAWVENENAIIIWDPNNGSRQTIDTGKETIIGLVFNPEGEILASSSGDKQVILWDVKSGTTNSSWDYPGWLVNLAYSPDGNQLVGAAQDEFAIPFFEAEDGKLQRRLEWTEHASPILYGAHISPDWKAIAWISRGTIQLMDSTSGELGSVLGHEDFINSMSWSPDSRLIATAAAGSINGGYSPLVTIWEATTGEKLATLVSVNPIYRVAFSPDGSVIAVLDATGQIKLWSLPFE